MPGIIGNHYAFFGLKIVDFELIVDKAAYGGTIDVEEYDQWFVLPDQARFGLENGRLTITLPVTA